MSTTKKKQAADLPESRLRRQSLGEGERSSEDSKRWLAENGDFIKSWNEWLAKNGFPLRKYRSF